MKRNALLDDPELRDGQRQRAAALHAQEVAKRRGPDSRPVTDAIFEERHPEEWAAAQLRNKGAEAFRATRPLGLGGHSYATGEVLLLWPSAPVRGFASKEQLQTLQGSEIELQQQGTWRVLETVFIGGNRYTQGDTIELFPENPTHGFIRAQDALLLLKESDLEIAELAPADA